MYEASLFVGVEVTSELKDDLKLSHQGAYKIFVNNGDEYLKECTHLEKKYLGKFLGGSIKTDSLNLMKENVESLLKRLSENFNFEQNKLSVLSVMETSS